ncbi:hypothetical protein JW877_03035, partial [bacterium]|nr:hypothetical protein [bacterium]
MVKKIVHSISLILAETLLPFFIWLFGITWRLEFIGPHHPPLEGGFIYAFWHGRMMVFAFSHRGKGIKVLVSEHRDGEY